MENGTWDFFRPSLRPEESMLAGPLDMDEIKEKRQARATAHELETKAFAGVPETERKHLRFLHYLPFRSIVEVDSAGDPTHECPHFYCTYTGPNGPYEAGAGVESQDGPLRGEMRGSFFEQEKRKGKGRSRGASEPASPK